MPAARDRSRGERHAPLLQESRTDRDVDAEQRGHAGEYAAHIACEMLAGRDPRARAHRAPRAARPRAGIKRVECLVRSRAASATSP